jgi:hypothetical protein
VATEQPTGSNPDLVPTPPRGFPAPVPTSPKGRTTTLIAGFVGLVIGAAVVGGAWLLFGNDGASSSPVSAPERISGYVRHGEAEVFDRNDSGKEVAQRRDDWDRRSGERLSESYDGSGAAVQTYTDDNVENTFTLELVRAPVEDPPYVPYSDPEVLGTDRPLDEMRRFGDVACVLRNDPGHTFVAACVRTGGELTVRISHVSGDLGQDPDKVAGLVDEAWDEVS